MAAGFWAGQESQEKRVGRYCGNKNLYKKNKNFLNTIDLPAAFVAFEVLNYGMLKLMSSQLATEMVCIE